jgi:hypothetical protein
MRFATLPAFPPASSIGEVTQFDGHPFSASNAKKTNVKSRQST